MGQSRRRRDRDHCLGVSCFFDPCGRPYPRVAATGTPAVGVLPRRTAINPGYGRRWSRPEDDREAGCREISPVKSAAADSITSHRQIIATPFSVFLIAHNWGLMARQPPVDADGRRLRFCTNHQEVGIKCTRAIRGFHRIYSGYPTACHRQLAMRPGIHRRWGRRSLFMRSFDAIAAPPSGR